MKLSPKLKSALKGILSLLAILKYLPLPSQWRGIILAVITLLSGLVTMLEKCDVTPDQQSTTKPPIVLSPTPDTKITHIPTASPTPTPKPLPKIIVPEVIKAGEPFIVRVTAPFNYNTNLAVDRFHLCILGQEYKTKMMSCTVTLWTAGKRTLRVTLADGTKLERQIDVAKTGPRAE